MPSNHPGLMPPDDDKDMHRRRQTDLPTQNLELILYQLGELKAAVREGFQKMEGRFDAVEIRVASLERWREREEERARAIAQQNASIDRRWIPIVLAIAALAVTIYLGLQGGK